MSQVTAEMIVDIDTYHFRENVGIPGIRQLLKAGSRAREDFKRKRPSGLTTRNFVQVFLLAGIVGFAWLLSASLFLLAIGLGVIAQEFKEPTAFLIGGVAILLAVGFVLIARWAARYRRRYGAESASKVLQRDDRPPVLLLRSFDDDDRGLDAFLTGYRVDGSRSFEEMLTDRLWKLGPVIAIGKPGERVPQAGAAREYLSHNDWQSHVSEAMGRAIVIVMILGASEGFGWELNHLSDMRLLRKVVLVIPPLDSENLKARARLVERFKRSGNSLCGSGAGKPLRRVCARRSRDIACEGAR